MLHTSVLYGVFRRVLQQRGEDATLQAAVLLHQGEVVAVDSATLWTQDADFKGLPEVRYRRS